MKKVLMVCLGNICRSPLAEGILRSKCDTLIVDSAGTASYHVGEPPDHRAINVARKNGIDISNLRARQFSINDFEEFDFIFAMDTNNYKDIINLTKSNEHKKKVFLILDKLNQSNQNVPDPYYGGDEGFNKVFNLLKKACNAIIEKY